MNKWTACFQFDVSSAKWTSLNNDPPPGIVPSPRSSPVVSSVNESVFLYGGVEYGRLQLLASSISCSAALRVHSLHLDLTGTRASAPQVAKERNGLHIQVHTAMVM